MSITLFFIKNIWDAEGREAWYESQEATTRYGTSNNVNVRFRSEPTLQGEHLGYLQKGDRVVILDETDETMKIGNMESVWYKIKTEDGVTGWAYGFFIDVE